VFLARKGADKDSIRAQIQRRFGYDLSRRVDDIRGDYGFDVTCQGSVPEAIICFLDSEDFEDAIRNAVSLGGDADTQGCIAGGIAEAYYRQIPDDILREVRKRTAKELWEKAVEFSRKFGVGKTLEQLDSLDGD
jgi:ADP-ribosylglycohydrolase